MLPKEIKRQKKIDKRLVDIPQFRGMRKGKLPKPFAKMGGSRFWATDFIDVSSSHQVIFIWKDGQILTDKAFFGWLFKKVGSDSRYPLFEMHWHPSHKGLHAKMPCLTESDYTNRQLPGAPELGLHTAKSYDPAIESDRLVLIDQFCKACGIKLGPPSELWS
jgi:hypothetical protein